MRFLGCVLVMGLLVSTVASGHPHEERQILRLRGALTKVDAVNRTVELDTVDPNTKRPRNLLLFLDKKVKLRRGKAKIELADLKPGHKVSSMVELTTDDEQSERFVALEIQIQQ
jgi:hypothetical protein